MFPELQRHVAPRELAKTVVDAAGKALVLAPTIRRAQSASDLAASDMDVQGPTGPLQDLLAAFRPSRRSLLMLANRYDGLDLPDAQCRVTVLDGMPGGAHLQERFISDTLLSGRVLRERQRTRVVQGAGRCTRGLRDHSVVVVLSDTLTRFLNVSEIHDSLRPELQAEIDFGVDNSEVTPDALLEVVRSFLAQDDDWREQAEPMLVEARQGAIRSLPPENEELAASARFEIRAFTAVWSGDWAAAGEAATEAAGCITSKQLLGYRALWLYLAAAWLGEDARDRDDEGARASSRALLRKAHAVARGTAWLRQVEPLASDEHVLSELDLTAVDSCSRSTIRTLAATAWTQQHVDMLGGLAQTEAAWFERSLVFLGKLLGAESYKPSGSGRTDAAWVWPQWWLAIEAKSDEKSDADVSQTTVRQANDQLKTLAHDRDESVPSDSAVLIVSPRELADPTATIVAESFVHLTSPANLVELAKDAVLAWKTIRARGVGLDEEQLSRLISRVLSEHSVLPSDVRDRLLIDAVHG